MVTTDTRTAVLVAALSVRGIGSTPLGGDTTGIVVAWPSGNDRITATYEVGSWWVAAYEDEAVDAPAIEQAAHDLDDATNLIYDLYQAGA